jgi:heat-inducible transcriptional repressor
VIDLLGQATQAVRTIYSDGLVNVLDPTHLVDQLEIADEGRREELLKALAVVDSEGARQTLHLLEEQRLLEEVLAEALTPGVQGVQVMIAGEGRWEELNQTSMILSHYGISGQTTGAIGVLGPVRLQYGRAISAVRYVAGLMSDMLIDIYGEGN